MTPTDLLKHASTDALDVLEAIFTRIDQKAGQSQVLLRDFAARYYQHTPRETLQSRPVEVLYEIVVAHWQLSCARQAGESRLQLFSPPPGQVGSPHLGFAIATDDRPFLLDSVCMELSRQKLNIYFVTHVGDLRVQRDQQGCEVQLARESAEPAGAVEALLYFEVDKPAAEEALSALEQGLRKVLAEVQAVVSDWQPMRQRVMACLSELEDHPPATHDLQDISEAQAFLRWLLNDHFIFLGCRNYVFSKEQGTLRMVRGASLGVLRDEAKSMVEKPLSALPPEARELALSPQILVFTTTNTRARVHRPVYTEYIGVKRFDEKGCLVGECRVIGLYTSKVYHSDARTIPLIRRKIEWAQTASQLPRSGHSGKALLDILLSLPHGDLLQATAEQLLTLARGVLAIQERPDIRLFVRPDSYRRFVSCLVYIPRERLSTELRQAMQRILMQAFSGLEMSFETVLGESPLARHHFLIRTASRKPLNYDIAHIEAELRMAARQWQDDLQTALLAQEGEFRGPYLFRKYAHAFPGGYRECYTGSEALPDIAHIEELSPVHPLEMRLYESPKQADAPLRFKLFQINRPLILSDVLPVLEKMGLQVIDEWPSEIHPENSPKVWVHDFGIQPLFPHPLDLKTLKPLFQDAFEHIWQGEAENDGFNTLTLNAGLTWREVVVLRAYAKYLRQIGVPFTQPYIETAITRHAGFAQLLIELFRLRFNPTRKADPESLAHVENALQNALDAVVSLDEDRILRHLLELVHATLRTNFFQKTAEGTPKRWLAFKLDPTRIAELPRPRPMYEIFVYSPQVEGVHLRAGKVARGGIRWSDRREDFRTEVLGLMKAQQVKNAVIVPAGAKGGFVCKQLPVERDRDALMQEVTCCYQTFIRGLLDLTDNLQSGVVSPPPDTVRYDDSDPYLVVAADKGTASFSDTANAIAEAYGFWLGDAFASGGSHGYDHKKMGITARGAWESVKRHCRALNLNPVQDNFTVVGIGDMSGDVFGNGMLLSEHIKLVAAFDHRHIFIDPDPNPKQSFAERKRLFELPRSSWGDYDPQLVSKGGRVFSRSLKSLSLTPEIKRLLGLEKEAITPDALIRSILRAPVDVLWNGGIGTYVKASTERHVEVGDKANDALRINAKELRCRSVAEGGNLGFTQLARVEYALNGGLIYTDFIDNSAGVDCSDHEVNSKILLNAVVASGQLSAEQRNQLLAQMTDEIAKLVLADNDQQTRAITLAALNAHYDIELYRGYLNSLERAGQIDRALEYLPDDAVLLARKAQGKGLTTPEIAVLLAYTKILVKAELLKAQVPHDGHLTRVLASAFPHPLRQRYAEQMLSHSLRQEIIATRISNLMINDMGVCFVYRLRRETNAPIVDIVRAYAIARRVLDLGVLMYNLEALSDRTPLATQYGLMQQLNRLSRRMARWFIDHYRNQLSDITSVVNRFIGPVTCLHQALPKLLSPDARTDWQQALSQLESLGVPHQTALHLVGAEHEYALLDIAETSLKSGYDLLDTGAVYFAVGERLGVDWLRNQIRRQPIETHWHTLGRVAQLDDLDTQQCRLTLAVLQEATFQRIAAQDNRSQAVALLEAWLDAHPDFDQQWKSLLAELRSVSELKPMMVTIVLRTLVSLTSGLGK